MLNTKTTPATTTPATTTPAPAKVAPAAKGKGKGKAPAKGKAPRKPAAPKVVKPGLRTVAAKGATLRSNHGLQSTVLMQGKWATTNPKQAGSGAFNRYAVYMALAKKHGNGKFTVAMVLQAGVQPSDLNYNVKKGYCVVRAAK